MTRTWEKWVRTLSLSYNPRDIDLLVAKIGILLDQVRRERDKYWLERCKQAKIETADVSYEAGKKEERERIKEFILPKVQKFIDKVESGMARSKETYADMKDIKQFIDSL